MVRPPTSSATSLHNAQGEYKEKDIPRDLSAIRGSTPEGRSYIALILDKPGVSVASGQFNNVSLYPIWTKTARPLVF